MHRLLRLWHLVARGQTAVVVTYVFLLTGLLLLFLTCLAWYLDSPSTRLIRIQGILSALFFAYMFARWPQEKRERRARKGLCPRCGYDLRATPGRCPECGHDPSATPV
jgi:hypothetical protein